MIPTLVLERSLALLQGGACAVYAVAQALLLALSAQRYLTLWRAARARPLVPPPPPAEWPRVTVQLPVYNERHVVERLVTAAAALDYPRDRLEIQVLDDSTDDTCERVDHAAAAARARGVAVTVLRRRTRAGYKAGALEAGRAVARGELLAVFDADFVPPRDFLTRLVPHFGDARVGMVQARWGHLNRDHSALTAAQAVLLDAHFGLEHRARMASGLFFNFNGTAGLWRRAAIEEAGGWSSDTLTEDLDLSYRAQLAGWRFLYDDAVEVPAELPEAVGALRSQQRRWAQGSIQTARKLLPRVWRAPLPWRVKVEAAAHLTGNAAFPLLVALTLSLAPARLAAAELPWTAAIALEAALFALGTLPVAWFLLAGQRRRGRPLASAVRDVVVALAVGAGLAPNNAVAVMRGLGTRVTEWERTPKTGVGARRGAGPAYAVAARGRGDFELGVALYLALLVVVTPARGWSTVPLVALMLVGYAYLGTLMRAEARSRS